MLGSKESLLLVIIDYLVLSVYCLLTLLLLGLGVRLGLLLATRLLLLLLLGCGRLLIDLGTGFLNDLRQFVGLGLNYVSVGALQSFFKGV